MELISVIVPVYKVEDYLDKCIESITKQTYKNLEIILVDDGSPDNCPGMCDAWALKDTRICVVHKQNDGAAQARNTGLDMANGPYIMFVDSDDYLDQEAIRTLYDCAAQDGSDLIIGKHSAVYGDGKIDNSGCAWTQNELLSREEMIAQFGKKRVFLSPWGKLYRREVLEGLRYPKLICGEDTWLFPYILDRCKTISLVNKNVYYYYQRSNSAAHCKNQKAEMDALEADISVLQYLLNADAIENARMRYLRCVCEIAVMRDQKLGREKLEASVSSKVRRQIMRGATIKMRVQSMYLYFPALYTSIQWAKHMLRKLRSF